jgi:hypothetical protein
MPDAHNNAKMTGDTHPPDVEPYLPSEKETPDAAGASETAQNRVTSTERGAKVPPGGSRKAGMPKDKDDENRDSSANTRDSGESPDGDQS